MPKKKRERKPRHKQSLHEQIEDPETYGVRTHPRQEKKRRRGEDEEEQELLDAKISGRILKAAREQQEEVDAEDADEEREAGGGAQLTMREALQKLAAQADESDDSDSDWDGDTAGGDDDGGLRGLVYGRQDEEQEEEEVEEVDPDDERAMAAFMAPDASGFKQVNLTDLILQRISEKQAEQGLATLPGPEGEEPGPSGPGPSAPLPDGSLEPKVVEVYRGVGKLLSRFTSGKVPKAFKIIPNLRNWEDVLYLTDPDGWSVHAMFEATKLFVSNLNARLAQRFLALVLLPRIRQEIREHRKLHFALFQALRKATYKPGAFYKGILLPLCQSRTCTLREAVTLTSVLKRASLPVLHSAAALLRLSQMEYCGTTSFFIRVLLDKKYALPYKVIDALVDHFVRFGDDERQMPVVWHQSLLVFVQRYKDEIRPDDVTALRQLCSRQHHYRVSPEVQRELDNSRARGGALSGPTPMDGVRGGAAAVAAQKSKAGQGAAENLRDMPPVLMMDD